MATIPASPSESPKRQPDQRRPANDPGLRQPPPQKKSFLDTLVSEATEATTPAEKVYVYEAPVRLWHWANALCIIVLCVTGYLIGSPLPSMPGEASDHFLFGNIRMAHFIAGEIMAIAFLGRIYWAFMGNHHARQIFLLPVWSKKWWREVWHEIRWYSFAAKTPKKYVGHNPLAQLAMFTLLVVPLVLQILTGFALYAEGQGTDTWWFSAFGWVFGLFGHNSFAVHTYHHLVMWLIVLFTMVHIYVAIREDIMSRQSLISTMISGWRYFKDDRE
ncbi:MAG: Ni/Fe-hydrogenase, b-type cytochrome subunit [Pseudomonadota bacterium]